MGAESVEYSIISFLAKAHHMSDSQRKWFLATIILLLTASFVWRLSSPHASVDALASGLDPAQQIPSLSDTKLTSPDGSEPGPRAQAAKSVSPEAPPAAEPTDPDSQPPWEGAVLWIRLRDRRFKNPVSGAKLSSYEPNRLSHGGLELASFPDTESDAGGLAEIRLPDGYKGVVRVRAAGFGTSLIPVLPGHEESTRPLTIDLTRSARVTIRVLDSAANAVPHAKVVLETHSFNLLNPGNNWYLVGEVLCQAETDAEGRCTIDDVPSEVPFSGHASWENGGRYEETKMLVLEPGEHRQVQWGGEPTTRLTGHLFDQYGQPVAQHTIWLSQKTMYSKPDLDRAYFCSSDEEAAFAKTNTDDNGRFAFDHVPSGDWWIGPGAIRAFRAKRNEYAVAPIATRVSVLGTSSERRVALKTARGLYISGKISMPNDDIFDHGWVSVACELGSVLAHVSKDFPVAPGEGQIRNIRQFRAGPLAELEHELCARGPDFTAPSKPVSAWPGATDVWLKLQMGAAMTCTTKRADTGQPCPAVVTISAITTPYRRVGARPETKHAFSKLIPGSYHLAASSPVGLFGQLGPIDLQAGQNLENLVIPLSEGTTLRIHYTGPPPHGRFEVFADGLVIALCWLHPGTSTTVVVPPGAIVVQLTHRSGKVEKKRVQCELKQTAQVSFPQGD